MRRTLIDGKTCQKLSLAETKTSVLWWSHHTRSGLRPHFFSVQSLTRFRRRLLATFAKLKMQKKKFPQKGKSHFMDGNKWLWLWSERRTTWERKCRPPIHLARMISSVFAVCNCEIHLTLWIGTTKVSYTNDARKMSRFDAFSSRRLRSWWLAPLSLCRPPPHSLSLFLFPLSPLNHRALWHGTRSMWPLLVTHDHFPKFYLSYPFQIIAIDSIRMLLAFGF